MKKSNISSNNPNSECDNSFSNCHKIHPNQQVSQVSETESDVDSSTSKYVVQNDNRERRDGPGGN